MAMGVQEAHATELAALKEEALSTQQATEEEHAQALADKAAALESLGSHAHKLQEKLDEAPAAFKALAELKELRVKYKYVAGCTGCQFAHISD